MAETELTDQEKTEVCDRIFEAEANRRKAFLRLQQAKEALKTARAEYDAAEEVLHRLAGAATEDHPLFDGDGDGESWRDALLENIGLSETDVDDLRRIGIATCGALHDEMAVKADEWDDGRLTSKQRARITNRFNEHMAEAKD